MKHNDDNAPANGSEPILDFISGRTNTPSAMRLTKEIRSLHSLWILAKMSRSVKKTVAK